MLSHHEKQSVVNILDDVLGPGTSMKNDEQAHYCPFCHHHKKKLQINLQSQKWHCWVCDSKGKRIQSLLRRLHVDSRKLKKIYEIYGDDYVVYSNNTEDEKVELRLPSEFQSLLIEPKGINPLFRKVKEYARKRGISEGDIKRYNIGYCDGGHYANRIIIPSYDSDNRLNYFIARSVFDEETFKYKNPPVSKNVIMFENQINWDEPITLVEGVFDAILIDGISVLGNGVTAEQAHLIDKLNKRIILCPDRDNAGKELIDKAIELGWEVSFPPWHKDIKDAADAVQKYGRMLTLSSIIKYAVDNKIKAQVQAKML